ncbi:unnamed protein product [Allacma fusca]|uniref:Peptidase S8/S53 domain-containing protein n=1 Tax=Allacma fusca TaxID=39272 RepID=A0A8J2P9T1_9HEXA|nr:unnamed protein product [Allacma fusca]
MPTLQYSSVLFKCLLVLHILTIAVRSEVISAKLKESLEKKSVANITITFKTRPSEALNRVASKIKTITNRGTILEILSDELERDALKSQKTTLGLLQSGKTTPKFLSLWLTNQISVQGASIDLVNKIASLDEVSRVEECRTFVLYTEKDSVKFEEYEGRAELPIALIPPGYGVSRTQADEVWKLGYDGSGIVVGIIDSGVRLTHDVLRETYVGTDNYGWFDPDQLSKYPYDIMIYEGHGTACIGPAVASNGIGIAPAAKWMACKVVDADKVWHQDWIIACLQFMLCPTDHQGNNKNCSKAPHVINNSWYYPAGEDDAVLREITPVLVASQINFVFCAGNQGPGCGTVAPPGSYKEFIAVGGADFKDILTPSSGWGPGEGGMIKPDVIAAGKYVPIAHVSSDYAYSTESGTSLASPQVAGVIALMLQKNPTLTPPEINKILRNTAINNVTLNNQDECGGVPVDKIPNHQIGYGYVNALNAVNAVTALH